MSLRTEICLLSLRLELTEFGSYMEGEMPKGERVSHGSPFLPYKLKNYDTATEVVIATHIFRFDAVVNVERFEL